MSIFTPSCWAGCLPRRPGARWHFTRRRGRATPRSRRRSRRSASGGNGRWGGRGRRPPGGRGGGRRTAAVTSRGPRQAYLEGFDLHANVWVSANDRAGLERLCRYILRPPFAQERLRLGGGGRGALRLK